MITRNDCLVLLKDIQNKGVDTKDVVNALVKANTPTPEVIKFINDNRELSLVKFYEKIRKCYNEKHSKIYKNIVKEIEDPQEVLVTLSALLTQILLFSKNLEDKQMFLKHSRSYEISLVLQNYFKTYDLTNCINLLRLIKADIKCLESIKQPAAV